MATLHATAAPIAASHVNVKPPDDHARNRQFFLILGGDACPPDRPGAVGTARWQRDIVSLVHAGRRPSTRLRAIRAPPPFGLAASDLASAVSQKAPPGGTPPAVLRPVAVSGDRSDVGVARSLADDTDWRKRAEEAERERDALRCARDQLQRSAIRHFDDSGTCQLCQNSSSGTRPAKPNQLLLHLRVVLLRVSQNIIDVRWLCDRGRRCQ